MYKIFKIKNNNLNAGFSLVEMLVATGIFMSIMTLAITSLISIMGANKKAHTIKGTIDSVNFAIENISRDMRMGTDYKCMLPDETFTNVNCPLDIGSTAVRYKNNLGTKGITYQFLANGELTRQICDADYISNCATAKLISTDSGANITSMKFYVIGADHELDSPASTRTQPRVLISTSGLISVKGAGDTTFNLQTSISQRIRR